MEPPTPYSQVVDNTTPDRFYSAQPWKKSDGRLTRYGKDFRHTRPGKDGAPAWFKVRIPSSGFYTVYARWPAAKGNNPKARFRISTASGLRNVEVDQRRDSGTWVRLGAYRMEESDRYSVQVSGRSKADGRIVADAVMVVAGTQAAPQDPNDSASAGGGGTPRHRRRRCGLRGDRKGQDAPGHPLQALAPDALPGLPVGGLLLLYEPGLQQVGLDA